LAWKEEQAFGGDKINEDQTPAVSIPNDLIIGMIKDALQNPI
jgi:hypothetical protein